MDNQNIDAKHTLRAFTPSRAEILLLPAFSLFFLLISSGYAFYSSKSKQYPMVSDFLHDQLQTGLSYLDKFIGPTALTALFWAFIGVTVYLLLWLSFGAYHAYRQDIPREKGMILPKSYNRAAVVRGSVAHICIRVIAVGLLAFWIYLLFIQVLPYTSDIFFREFSHPSVLTPLYCFGATILLAIWLFFIAVLSRCTVLRDRVFNY